MIAIFVPVSEFLQSESACHLNTRATDGVAMDSPSLKAAQIRRIKIFKARRPHSLSPTQPLESKRRSSRRKGLKLRHPIGLKLRRLTVWRHALRSLSFCAFVSFSSRVRCQCVFSPSVLSMLQLTFPNRAAPSVNRKTSLEFQDLL